MNNQSRMSLHAMRCWTSFEYSQFSSFSRIFLSLKNFPIYANIIVSPHIHSTPVECDTVFFPSLRFSVHKANAQVSFFLFDWIMLGLPLYSLSLSCHPHFSSPSLSFFFYILFSTSHSVSNEFFHSIKWYHSQAFYKTKCIGDSHFHATSKSSFVSNRERKCKFF